MSKYICQICGYVYDDAAEKTPFDALPADWVCPLCGAAKDQFKKKEQTAPPVRAAEAPMPDASEELRELSDGALAAILSNLARGCEKQYKAEEAGLYAALAAYFTERTKTTPQATIKALEERARNNINQEYPAAMAAAEAASDRGAKRALSWSEKVTKMTASMLARYEKEGSAMLENKKIWVCDICGFVYIGDFPPAVCPICKVPSFKLLEVARG